MYHLPLPQPNRCPSKVLIKDSLPILPLILLWHRLLPSSCFVAPWAEASAAKSASGVTPWRRGVRDMSRGIARWRKMKMIPYCKHVFHPLLLPKPNFQPCGSNRDLCYRGVIHWRNKFVLFFFDSIRLRYFALIVAMAFLWIFYLRGLCFAWFGFIWFASSITWNIWILCALRFLQRNQLRDGHLASDERLVLAVRDNKLHEAGDSLFWNCLPDREKKVLMIVIPLQVLANLASVVIGETGPFIKYWVTWNQVFLLVDIICSVLLFSLLFDL